jgi:GR25 family glycosyltransferase involved in LPS biosynthesis
MEDQRENIIQFIRENFEKVFVISLERSTDRHKHIAQELEGLDFEIVWGHDNKLFSKTELQNNKIYDETSAKHHSRYNEPMRMPQVSCALSHRFAAQKVIDYGLKNALIFEDDVRLLDSKFYRNLYEDVPAHWDILYLGYWKYLKPTFWGRIKQALYLLMQPLKMIRLSKNEILYRYPRPLNTSFSLSGQHEGAYAYAINTKAARKIIEKNSPICMPSDSLLKYLSAHSDLISIAVKEPFIAESSFFEEGDSQLFKSLIK